MFLVDEQLSALWKHLQKICPELNQLQIVEQWEQEMLALGQENLYANENMEATRIMIGLAVLSRGFFKIDNKHRGKLEKQFRQQLIRHTRVTSLMSLVFEMQVACRLAQAGMEFRFLAESKQQKTPDLAVDQFNLLIECKNLKPRDFRSANVNGMCAQMRKHSRKAADQLKAGDPTDNKNKVVIFHLPPDPRGFFTNQQKSERINLSLAASGSQERGPSGTPGPLAAIFVESSLNQMYDRPCLPGEPSEYWHNFPIFSLTNPEISRFAWQLYMSMSVCPFEGFAYPTQIMGNYLLGQTAEELKLMQPELALNLWDEWNERTGARINRRTVPPFWLLPQNTDNPSKS